MEKLTLEQRCFGWASGHYLADEINEAYWQLNDQEKFKYLEENAWEPFENYRGKEINQWIYQLAYDIKNGLFPMKGDAYDQGEENS